VKTFRFTGLSPDLIESLSEDLIRNSRVSHERVSQFIGVFRVRGCISRISEYCDAGSLRDVLRQCNRPLLKDTILRLASGLCEGMLFLHSQSPPIIHAYLKTTNVLVGPDMNLKITDLGLRRIKACMELTSLQRCFTAFTSPECFYGNSPTRASDVYGFGMVCYEMITRKPPFENRDIRYVKEFVAQRRRKLDIPECDLPRDFLKDVASCWETIPADRPSFVNLKETLDRLDRQGFHHFTPNATAASSLGLGMNSEMKSEVNGANSGVFASVRSMFYPENAK